MKNKYYLNGTIFGLALVPLVAMAIVPVKIIVEMLSTWRFSIPIVVGYLCALLAGKLADKFIHRRGIMATVIVLVVVFTVGVFFGCGANFLANGELQRPEFGMANQIWNWFAKPAYWLMVIGGPCAVVVAVIHYLAHKLFSRWQSRRMNQYS